MTAISGHVLVAGMGATDCDLTTELFKRSSEALGMTFMGAVTGQAYEAGEVVDDHEAIQAIKALAASIKVVLN